MNGIHRLNYDMTEVDSDWERKRIAALGAAGVQLAGQFIITLLSQKTHRFGEDCYNW